MVKAFDFIHGEGWPLSVGMDLSRPQDFVGVGVADPGHKGRAREHTLDLAAGKDQVDLSSPSFSSREKRNTFKIFGILVNSLVRDGDIPCRYEDNHFLILLPFTEEHNAAILKERIKEALQKDKWMRSKQISFDFNITEFDKSESERAFIVRTLA